MTHEPADIEKIARICYEANRAYSFTIGDYSQPTWDMAAPWQKESNVAGVESVLADPSKSPEQSHFEWMERKLKAGWKHGPAKRPEMLEHPCLVPWSELPPEQRVKDVLFIAVVNAVAGTGRPAVEAPQTPPPASDSTLEVGILTPEGDVVKGGEIVEEVKKKKVRKPKAGVAP